MLADLHAHYPMRVVEDLTPQTALQRMRHALGRPPGDMFRALFLRIASMLGSDRTPWSGYRITVETLRKGDVGLAMSVLYSPLDEMDLSKRYMAPPAPEYFPHLLEDIERVEREVASHDRNVIRLVHNRGELDQCLADRATALVHAVEGGFHLGEDIDEIDAHVAELVGRGVAYVTVAHLFFRQVATNANALPFLSEGVYAAVFPQPTDDALTPRGRALIAALVKHRVLIDISHMSPAAVEQTLALLDDELDPDGTVPVISSHAGFRFGEQKYMHDKDTVLAIQRHNGVIGLIMAQHQLNDGIVKQTKTFEESFPVICRHIDRIADITGSHEHVALGTDFDGFIKPTMGGLENMGDLTQLEEALNKRYGADAELISSRNALRVLQAIWP